MSKICMYGGRGASSSYGGDQNTGGTGRRMKFYDKTQKYQGMSKHQFENAIRDKTVEYIGIFNDKGELVAAGTSYSPNAVSVPTNHPRWNEVHDLTHNHPYKPANEPHRTIGASFSTADVTNHVMLGIKGETRAVSNGPNENTYIFRAMRVSGDMGTSSATGLLQSVVGFVTVVFTNNAGLLSFLLLKYVCKCIFALASK